METSYKIKKITSARDKDLTAALDIYLNSVDDHSDTPTLQIRDYIDKKYNDSRKMFFYILYVNGKVAGFAEYGYLPSSEVLLIDYLNTEPRNHTYFYNFYHMTLEDITSILEKENYFIKYIVTELSLKKDSSNRYIDTDSNYFRQLLSLEEFKILKTPYYQPYFNLIHKLELSEFNLAIKPLVNGLFNKTVIDKTFYNGLLTDIYLNHYFAWYEKFMDADEVKNFFDDLLNRIKKEFADKIEIDDITLVNCVLFQNGLCKQISTENITLRKKRTHCIKQWGARLGCVIFSIITAVLCYSTRFDSIVTFICSLFTILTSTIALCQFVKNDFLSK